MSRFEVPDLVKGDIMLLLLRKDVDDNFEQALNIIKPKIKPNLSFEEERELIRILVTWSSHVKRKWTKTRRNMNRFKSKEAEWLYTSLTLPLHFKVVKSNPPDVQGDNGEEDRVKFRQPSNYCFVCSTTIACDWSLPITTRLAKSMCSALSLESTEEVKFDSNLVDCSLCSKCYDKVIEVNDAVIELEQIQVTLGKLTSELDEFLATGVEAQKDLQVEFHGVGDKYLTPSELRKEIIKSRQKESSVPASKSLPVKSVTIPIPFNTKTRRSANVYRALQDLDIPHITSVMSLAASTVVHSPQMEDVLFGNTDSPILSDSEPVSVSMLENRKRVAPDSSLLESEVNSEDTMKPKIRKQQTPKGGSVTSAVVTGIRRKGSVVHSSAKHLLPVTTKYRGEGDGQDTSSQHTYYEIDEADMSKFSPELAPGEGANDNLLGAYSSGNQAHAPGLKSSTKAQPAFLLWEKVQNGDLRLVNVVGQDGLDANIPLRCKIPRCAYRCFDPVSLLQHVKECHGQGCKNRKRAEATLVNSAARLNSPKQHGNRNLQHVIPDVVDLENPDAVEYKLQTTKTTPKPNATSPVVPSTSKRQSPAILRRNINTKTRKQVSGIVALSATTERSRSERKMRKAQLVTHHDTNTDSEFESNEPEYLESPEERDDGGHGSEDMDTCSRNDHNYHGQVGRNNQVVISSLEQSAQDVPGGIPHNKLQHRTPVPLIFKTKKIRIPRLKSVVSSKKPTDDDTGKLRCKIPGCGFRFMGDDPERVLGHARCHQNDPRPYKCSFLNCTRTYKIFPDLVKHRQKHGIFHPRTRPFPCHECRNSYCTAKHLSNHIESVHSATAQQVFSCPDCPKTFPKSFLLKSHSLVHQPMTLKCPADSCSAMFRTKSSLHAHQGRRHPEEYPQFRPKPTPKVVCHECGKVYSDISGLKGHVRKNHTPGVKIVRKNHLRKCYAPNCGFTSTDFLAMKTHKQTHSAVELTRRLVCSVSDCPRRFYTESSRKVHERLHDPNFQTLQCEHCGKGGFVHSFHLRKHASICLGKRIKEYVCSRCSSAFAAEEYLARHNLRHPNCKPKEPGPGAVYCPECNKCCSSTNSLNRHIQILHNSEDKPWECSGCGKSFSIRMYLNRHLKECKVCPASKVYIPPDGNETTTGGTQCE